MNKFQGSVNILLTSMAAIDFLLLLCSLFLFGLPALADHWAKSKTGPVVWMAKTTRDWLLYMVSK